MSKYGIPYQGSKANICDTLLKYLPHGKRFVDLFGGGFAMSHAALLSHKYESILYNEINPLLPPLIQKAIRGDYNYKNFKPKFISREEFFEKKDTDGYIKYIWSFGNDGEAYLFGKEIEDKKKSLHNFIVFKECDELIKTLEGIDEFIPDTLNDINKRRINLRRYFKSINKRCDLEQLQQLEQLERLQQLEQLEQLQQLELEFTTKDYKEYEYKEGDVVYCDPPYEGTKGYNKEKFDSKAFYDWVATRNYPVYFSSYNISDDRFQIVYCKNKRSLMNGASSLLYKEECLYWNGK